MTAVVAGPTPRPSDRPAARHLAKRPADQLTVIIPAYNEARIGRGHRAKCAGSRRRRRPGSSWSTTARPTTQRGSAREAGAQVITPPANTGSKAGAQNVALEYVDTPYCMAIDADTTLAPDAIERLLAPLHRTRELAATCGFVVPRHVSSVWERGRYIEYLLSFTFYKPTQDYYGKPLISSGCFSAYRTDRLLEAGGWSERTRAEDMDLTWTFYQAGHQVRFVPEALCYPIEPHDFDFMGKQLKRWSHGFVQNVSLHWKGILPLGFLSTVVGVAFFDAVVASVIYLFVLPDPGRRAAGALDPAGLRHRRAGRDRAGPRGCAAARGDRPGTGLAARASSCCARSTASSWSRRWSPSWCCAAHSSSTRRVTDEQRRIARNRTRRDVLPRPGVLDAVRRAAQDPAGQEQQGAVAPGRHSSSPWRAGSSHRWGSPRRPT